MTLIHGKYDSSPPTYPNGGMGALAVDSQGRLKTTPAPLAGGTDFVSINDGTNTANVAAVATGQNGLIVASGAKEYASLSTASTTNNDLQASVDVSNFKGFSLQLLGTWTGTVRVQGSNDNTNFSTIGVFTPNGTNVVVGDLTGNGLYVGQIYTRYIRVRVVTGGTGTVQGVLELSTTAPPSIAANVQQGTSPWVTTQQPTTSGGLTTHHVVSAASTNATTVKASSGQLYGWQITNTNAATRKIAFHNSSTSPTAGSSVFFSIVVPASGSAQLSVDSGIPFSSGISYTMVTESADSGTTAVGAADLIANLFYK